MSQPLWQQVLEATITAMISTTLNLSITFIATVVIPLTFLRIVINMFLYPFKLLLVTLTEAFKE